MNDFWGDSGDSDSSDGLASLLVGAATSLGTTAILATQSPNAIAPGSYQPGQSSYGYQQPYRSSSMNLFLFAALAIAAFFLIREF